MDKKEGYSNVYDFLMRPHRKNQEIKRLEETIEELRSCLLPGAIDYSKDNVQTSPRNQQEETIIKIQELEAKREKLKSERAALIIETTEAIDLLGDPLEQSVLTYYYIKRERLGIIAKEVGYSVRHMLRIKKHGVEHLAENMESQGGF